MTDTIELLVLRLEGLLQSWGEHSKWDRRDSADLPTRSGIIGLLGCALGLPRNDPEMIELNRAVAIGVRADRSGSRTVDYQTVTAENGLMTASGKKRSLGNTIVSEREYLEDACFTVFIEPDPEWRERLIKALNDPRWPVYLGRKNCVPSRPVYVGYDDRYTSIKDAIRRYPRADRSDTVIAYEIEQDDPTLSSHTRPDDPIGPNRRFDERLTWRGILKEDCDVSV